MKGDCPDSPAADSQFDADWKELSPLHLAHLFIGRYLFASRWLREPPVDKDEMPVGTRHFVLIDLPQVVADPFEGFIITLDVKHLVS
jgi:hypothetical protein